MSEGYVSLGNRRNHVDHGISWMARAVDVAVMLIAAPILLPFGLLIATAVFLDSPGPVLFRTRRVGLRGREFSMLKYRSMRGESRGPSLAGASDERITSLGSFLRTTRLDELPQMWNVLCGEMRLVGPRPELAEFTELYREEYREILSTPPGLTGPTQVAFAAAEARILAGKPDPGRFYAESLLPQKIQKDLFYVRSHSALGDLSLLAQTVLLPLRLSFKRLTQLLWRPQLRRPTSLLGVGGAAVLLAVMFIAASGPTR